jgi:hypothetical protein
MSEKPILFNSEMVKAILDGRKTVTRRVIKNGNRTPIGIGRDKFYIFVNTLNGKPFCGAGFYKDSDIFVTDGAHHTDAEYFKMPYKVGDILYVRETWWKGDLLDSNENIIESGITLYKADEPNIPSYGNEEYSLYKWRPSIHMPKESARIFLRVTDVRVERLQDITEEQAVSEGVKAYGQNNCSGTSARIAFAELWNSTTNKKEFEWLSNPWVWVIEFERRG